MGQTYWPGGYDSEPAKPLPQYDIGSWPGGYGGEDTHYEPPPQSWMDWSIETGLRTLPPVAGGFLGSLGGPVGSALGAAGGAGLGQYWGDLYANEESGPAEYAVNMGLSAIPGFLGASKALTPGMRALGNMGRGALEGAVTNVAGTPFEEWAETGSFRPSMGRVTGAATGGALFGAGFGGALSAGNDIWRNAAPPPPVESTPSMPLGIRPEGYGPELPAGHFPVNPGIGPTHGPDQFIGPLPPQYGPEPPVYGPQPITAGRDELTFNNPYTPQRMGGGAFDTNPPYTQQPPLDFETPIPEQQGFNFGSYQGPRGRFTSTGPGLPPRMGPDVGVQPPGQSSLDFAPPPTQQPTQGGLDFNYVEPPPPFTGRDFYPPDPPPFVPPAPPAGPPPAGGGNTPIAPNVPPAATGVGAPVFYANGDVAVVQNPSDVGTVDMLRNQGFVALVGLRSHDNKVIMVKGKDAPAYVAGTKHLPTIADAPTPPPAPVAPPPPPTGRPNVAGPIPSGSIPAGKNLTVPNTVATPTYVQNLIASGYTQVGKDPNNTYFTREEANFQRVEDEVPREGAMTIPSRTLEGEVQGASNEPRLDTFAGINGRTLGRYLAENGITQFWSLSYPEKLKITRAFREWAGPPRSVLDPDTPDAGWSNTIDVPAQGRLEGIPEVGNQRGMSDQDMLALRAQQVLGENWGGNEPVQQSMIPDFQDAEASELMRRMGIDTSGRHGNESPQKEVVDFDEFQESKLTAVTDIAVAHDNFNNLDIELQYAKRDGNPDRIEQVGFLRDVALDHYRQLARASAGNEFSPKVREDGRYPEGFVPDEPTFARTRKGKLTPVATGNTQKLTDALVTMSEVKGTKRKPVILDSGSRLTYDELNTIADNTVIEKLVRVTDDTVDEALKLTGRKQAIDRVDKIGVLLDPSSHGIHIPDPANNKSTILINWFARWGKQKPADAAWGTAITNLHESAHVGREAGTAIQLTEADMNDPRLGKFLKTYLQQIQDNADWLKKKPTDSGHGIDYAHRLGEIYATFGIERTFATAARIESILTDGGKHAGGYRPEVQELLHIYTESRGRPATTTDFLARTGTKQADRGRGGEGDIPGNSKADRDGAAAGVNNLFQREHDHPEVSKFRQLPDANSFHDTRFILPDGTRKTHNDEIHEFAARKVGSSLSKAIPAGVIRFTEYGTGAEVGAPITYAQAQVLKDAIDFQSSPGQRGFERFYVDIRMPGGEFRHAGFSERDSVSGIKNRIAQFFKDESAPVTDAERPQFERIEAEDTPAEGAVDPNDTSKWRNIKQKAGWGQGNTGEKPEVSWIKEVLALPSAVTTTLDFSAPGRQGLPMILTKDFWKAAGTMFKGLSKEGFDAIDADLQAKPIFQDHINSDGTVTPSFAKQIGMKLFRPASEAPMNQRAQATASNWLETGGDIPYASAFYRHTAGKPIRASNRAFITFLNHLNANRTEFLLNKARDMAIEGLDTGKVRQGMMPWKTRVSETEAMNLNPYHNLKLGREIAEFVNTATGHGPLKTHLWPSRSGEVSLEKASEALGSVLFSPGLLARNIRMLNPMTYIMATPFVRKQYTKAALSAAAAWSAFALMAKMAGAEVGDEGTSADAGKIILGNTRIDPGAGFLQFIVLYNRMYQGGYTSSATGEFHKFGEGYQAETQLSNVMRFGANKLNPVAKFAYDVANASEYNPFHLKDRTVQMFVPLFVQDIISTVKEDPEMIPWLAPMMFGVGAQTYSKGESVGKIIPTESDTLITGGGVADLGPDYIHPRMDY